MQEEIRKIIISKMGLTDASPEMQDKIIEECGLMIYQASLIRAMESMSDEEVKEIEKMFDESKSPNEVFTFLKSKVENFEDILGEEAEKILTYMKNIEDKIGK